MPHASSTVRLLARYREHTTFASLSASLAPIDTGPHFDST
jgi:hypothetical protein